MRGGDARLHGRTVSMTVALAADAALPRGFGWLMGAQFASALADNALLIVSIALLEARGLPGWWAPLLKVGLIAAYVAFAPWVGPLADSFAKGRVMAAMNLVKVLGLLAVMTGLHPVLAMAVVGLGAAGYAPAKYGLVTELVQVVRQPRPLDLVGDPGTAEVGRRDLGGRRRLVHRARLDRFVQVRPVHRVGDVATLNPVLDAVPRLGGAVALLRVHGVHAHVEGGVVPVDAGVLDRLGTTGKMNTLGIEDVLQVLCHILADAVIGDQDTARGVVGWLDGYWRSSVKTYVKTMEAVRGSGTEPKIKFYLFGQSKVKNAKVLPEVKAATKAALEELRKQVEADAAVRAEG
jgi:hypothetical protein